MTLLTRPLGQSALTITSVGIGTAPIGSTPAWQVYWGPQDERDAIRAIHTALDCGVNWIDTAPFYGWGRAESLIGQAVQGRRDQVLLFTKCGTLADGQGGWRECLTPDSIRQEVETSLRNLRTDYLDLLQFHDPDPHTPIEESWREVQRLIQEGKVRYAGLSNHPIDLMTRAIALAPITSNQHQYNLLQRTVEADVLPYSARHGIGFLAWSPLASGFLTDAFDLDALDPQDFRRRHPYAEPSRYARLTALKRILRTIADDHQKTMADLAIAWALRQPAVTGVIVGIRNAREATAMVGGTSWRLTAEELATIEQALGGWDE